MIALGVAVVILNLLSVFDLDATTLQPNWAKPKLCNFVVFRRTIVYTLNNPLSDACDIGQFLGKIYALFQVLQANI